MKISNIRIIGVQEEQIHMKGNENIFNKFTGENFPDLKKDMPIKVQKGYIKDKKTQSPYYIIVKTLNVENKEKILKLQEKKTKPNIKAGLLEKCLTLYWRLESQ